jgi:hypothetical protein
MNKIFLRKSIITCMLVVLAYNNSTAQLSPVIEGWLINTTGIKARHYAQGNPTPITDADSANVQTVLYSTNWVYVRTKGLPSYITGPFSMNPTIAQNQNATFKITRTPVKNNGTPTPTSMGIQGVFINGVSLFNYGDGVSWKNSTGTIAGGPIAGGPGDGVWNRDAVLAEKTGFDCAKGHPAIGNYHHHQNPSAFNLDLTVLSTICNTYNADGLYSIDSTRHSPLIGFAHDGFPIYGAYGYKNVDGTGAIIRMKSGFKLRTGITVRNTLYTGASVTSGPNVSATYPLGYFKEDYTYTPTTVATPDYLDEHNGRFCKTPEYPLGTYCYFATVDANWNSAYPYLIGETFYGVKNTVKVTSITEPVTLYTPPVVVPIRLQTFTGVVQQNTVQLSWQIATIENVHYFEMEKSLDGLNFEKVGTISANNSNINQPFNFTDSRYNSQTKVFYRLKQVDKDGSFSYSYILPINAKGSITGIKIFPNPAADLILIQINDVLRHDIKVSLSNMNGQVVLQKDFYQGSTICFLETDTVYEGAYVLTVNDNGSKQSFKVLIKK